jgi:hypothetical protein
MKKYIIKLKKQRKERLHEHLARTEVYQHISNSRLSLTLQSAMEMMNLTTLFPQSLNLSSSMALVSTNSEELIVKIFKTLAYAIILVVAVVGNSFLILAYRRNVSGQMRSIYNLLVASIAASDLLLAIWSIPERITRVMTDDAWHVHGVLGE